MSYNLKYMFLEGERRGCWISFS